MSAQEEALSRPDFRRLRREVKIRETSAARFRNRLRIKRLNAELEIMKRDHGNRG